ncbi:MAG: sulfite exporter TauE/SafE family protein [Chloroflexota bacterium]
MPENFWLFILVGFLAQLVDGALGMAYGVITTTFLLSLGIPPVSASASVHMAETITTAASGLSHWGLGNVDMRTLRKLAPAGVLGAVAGAYLLVHIPGETIRPFVTLYLLGMGVYILLKVFHKIQPPAKAPRLAPLGLIGGFLDAAGGGGWGSIVSSTLIAGGSPPRYTVGSVNLAEFFVAASASLTFLTGASLVNGWIIAGLILGGVAASPVAAFAAKKLPARAMMVLVGSTIVLLGLRGILFLRPLAFIFSFAR